MIDGLLDELRERDGLGKALGPEYRDACPSAVQVSSRWEGRNVWALFFPGGSYPEVVVKVDYYERYKERLRREHEALLGLQERAELEGTVPRVVAFFESGPRLALVQTGLRGKPLAGLVRRRLRPNARAARRDHQRVLAWLARLQQAGKAQQKLVLRGDEVVSRAADQLGATRPAFLEHVGALARRWDGLELPLVPGHGDLAPSNCLVAGKGVAIIDWEGGLGHRSPLADVMIFLNHYGRMHAVGGSRRRRWDGTFRRLYLSDHWLGRATTESFAAHLRGLGLPTASAEYVFVSTLVDLAGGNAGAAQAGAASKYWTPFLRIYAKKFEDSRIADTAGERQPVA